jgi:hypothetical protein
VDERGQRLVRHQAIEFEFVVQFVVMVPARVDERDEPHAPLDETAGQQAVGREGVEHPFAARPGRVRLEGAFLPVEAVGRAGARALRRQVDQFRC